MNGVSRERLVGSFLALMVVVVLGTLGYYYLGQGMWSLSDCFYMTIITLTTVGYAEVLPRFDEVEHARAFTSLLILFGMGTFIYFASTLTAFIIEGDLRATLRRKRMEKRIAKLHDHYIVCGAGSTGRHVIEELLLAACPTVAIDVDGDALESIADANPRSHFSYIAGDATDDRLLATANLAAARGLVAALSSDKDNLYLTVSARQANPGLRIAARGSNLLVLDKLKKAGADTVVSPNYIGGMRLASELLRPHVVELLDSMMRPHGANVLIEEIEIPPHSKVAGRQLKDVDEGPVGHVAVLAARDSQVDGYVYNPGGGLRLREGLILFVLGPSEGVHALRELVAPP